MVSSILSCRLSHTARVVSSDMVWLSHVKGTGVTGSVPRGAPTLLLFLPDSLFCYLSSIRSSCCPKSSPWVSIRILLGTYVLFTVSFDYISKFSIWMNSCGRISKSTKCTCNMYVLHMLYGWIPFNALSCYVKNWSHCLMIGFFQGLGFSLLFSCHAEFVRVIELINTLGWILKVW
jgi:hypothetical protein